MKKYNVRLAHIKKMTKSQIRHGANSPVTINHQDSLAKVIRSKEDAEDFMANIESAFNRAK
jgi:hypothetical protein